MGVSALKRTKVNFTVTENWLVCIIGRFCITISDHTQSKSRQRFRVPPYI